MLLDLGVVGQGVQPVQLGLVGLGAQRLAVDRDQAGDIPIGGFDDVFGGVVLLVLLAQKIAERTMGARGVLAMLHGAAHQGGGIRQTAGPSTSVGMTNLLRGGEACRRKRQQG